MFLLSLHLLLKSYSYSKFFASYINIIFMVKFSYFSFSLSLTFSFFLFIYCFIFCMLFPCSSCERAIRIYSAGIFITIFMFWNKFKTDYLSGGKKEGRTSENKIRDKMNKIISAYTCKLVEFEFVANIFREFILTEYYLLVYLFLTLQYW